MVRKTMVTSNLSPLLRVVLSMAGSYRDIVDHLQRHGAEMMALETSGKSGATGHFAGKGAILRQMISTRALRLRRWWTPADRVLIIGWQALPILAFIKLHILAKPERCVLMACFVHSPKLRRVVNLLFRALRFDGLRFITFSRAERENLIENVGMDGSHVLFHLWRQEHGGRPKEDEIVDGNYLFAGGYSNRDYDTLLCAAERGGWSLMIVASSLNMIDQSRYSKAEIIRDVPEAEFERRLAGSRLVVMPLQSTGEACGQSVLLRVLRNGKPLITSRHESIVDYLGDDYPGFVPPGDVDALASAIERALSDLSFRAQLTNAIHAAKDRLAARGTPGEEIFAFLAS